MDTPKIDFLYKEPAEWTTWTSWDTCRDDRLPSYGITNTDTRYLTTYQGSSCYNRRTRYCQNQVSTGLKYARFGGLNQCYYNYISNSNGIDDHQDRTCPGLPAAPSKLCNCILIQIQGEMRGNISQSNH